MSRCQKVAVSDNSFPCWGTPISMPVEHRFLPNLINDYSKMFMNDTKYWDEGFVGVEDLVGSAFFYFKCLKKGWSL